MDVHAESVAQCYCDRRPAIIRAHMLAPSGVERPRARPAKFADGTGQRRLVHQGKKLRRLGDGPAGLVVDDHRHVEPANF
jgi:hypothetical protein